MQLRIPLYVDRISAGLGLAGERDAQERLTLGEARRRGPGTATRQPGGTWLEGAPGGRVSLPSGGDTAQMAGTGSDPRAQALARYLRERAAAFSLSADSADERHIAAAGMALLDAAGVAELLPGTDPRLARLTRAGRFESMPGGGSTFLETDNIRRAIQRPLSGTPKSGEEILDLLAESAWDG
jgi:hypothetical protein